MSKRLFQDCVPHPATERFHDDRERLKRLESTLKLLIYGQDEAITQGCLCGIKLSRAGFSAPRRPVGILSGPTGRKPSSQGSLPKCLRSNDSLLYEEYVGETYRFVDWRTLAASAWPKVGLLTDAVLKNPHAVLLLDEIEKAHLDFL